MTGKIVLKTALLALAFFFTPLVYSQTTSQILDAAAEARLGPPQSVGEAISRGMLSPEESQQVLNSMIASHWQEMELQREAAKQRQQAIQAAAQAAWVKSWQDGADHADENIDKALHYDMDLAKKGDDYGEYRMGQRYRDGEAVPRDLKRAKEWLSKAADQGLKPAIKELAHITNDFPEVAVTNNILVEIRPVPMPSPSSLSTKK
jgi:TPR repeat protein